MIISAPSRVPRPYQAGDFVTVGGGLMHWKVTGFFGEFSDIATLTLSDSPGNVNTNAHIRRLTLVRR